MAHLWWPYTSTFLVEHEGCDEDFFHCGAVELAQKLLGQFLYCHQSEIVVRILETEAYPEDDIVYNRLFTTNGLPELNAKFKIKGGTMVAWKPVSLYSEESRVHLCITAGTEDSGDVVDLRSCEPIEGTYTDHFFYVTYNIESDASINSILVFLLHDHTSKISEGLGNEWEGNPVLYEYGGVQLFYGTVPPKEKVLCGKRHLHRNLSEIGDGIYRFALETRKPNFQYKNKNTLKRLQE